MRAVQQPFKRVPAIPDDVIASEILFREQMVAKIREITKVFLVPPGGSIKYKQLL